MIKQRHTHGIPPIHPKTRSYPRFPKMTTWWMDDMFLKPSSIPTGTFNRTPSLPSELPGNGGAGFPGGRELLEFFLHIHTHTHRIAFRRCAAAVICE